MENVLTDQLPSPPPQQIFRPPLDPYDVVIHLRHKLLPRRHQAVDGSPEDPSHGSVTLKPSHDAKRIPVVDFDPVQCYLQELRVSVLVGFYYSPSLQKRTGFQVNSA